MKILLLATDPELKHYLPDTMLVSDGTCNLIITDLPHGLESLSALQKSYPGKPILYYGKDEALATQAIAQGAQDFLPQGNLNAANVMRTITFALERQYLRETLREQSFTDDLTNLYNRRGFLALLEQQMSLAKRSGLGFWLFFLDIDNFKQINDTYGHPAGDQALISLANSMRRAFRRHDLLARIGGDEFAVVAIHSQRETLDSLKSHFLSEVQKCEPPLSCSVGATYYLSEDLAPSDLLEHADQDLYKQKTKCHDSFGLEDKM